MDNIDSCKIALRFLAFPGDQSCLLDVSSECTVGKAKQMLFETGFPPATLPDNLRFIFSGKELKEDEVFGHILAGVETTGPITIHVVQRRPLPRQNDSSPNEEVNQEEMEENLQESIPHFHGCFFDEEEAAEVNVVFERKKGADGLMGIQEVERFLHVYWNWMKRENHRERGASFPREHFENVKRSVLKDAQRVNCEQFRSIFFLFDNDAPDSACPHGLKPRVQRCTEELHKSLMKKTDENPEQEQNEQVEEENPFSQSTFDSLFTKVDRDSDGILSCKEVELLFFLYSVTVTTN